MAPMPNATVVALVTYLVMTSGARGVNVDMCEIACTKAVWPHSSHRNPYVRLQTCA